MLLICNVFKFRKNLLVLVKIYKDNWFWEYKEIAFIRPFQQWYKINTNPIEIAVGGEQLETNLINSITFKIHLSSESIYRIYWKLIKWKSSYPNHSMVDYKEILSKELSEAGLKALDHVNKEWLKSRSDDESLSLVLRHYGKFFSDFFPEKNKTKLDYTHIHFERDVKDLNKSLVVKKVKD